MLKSKIFSYHESPRLSLPCCFCCLMKVDPFLLQVFTDYRCFLFWSLVEPFWWWAPGHCPNTYRVSPPSLSFKNIVINECSWWRYPYINKSEYLAVYYTWTINTWSLVPSNVPLEAYDANAMTSSKGIVIPGTVNACINIHWKKKEMQQIMN